MGMSASTEELLDVIKHMFPVEHDRAVAQLTIIKQQERITKLETALKDGSES